MSNPASSASARKVSAARGIESCRQPHVSVYTRTRGRPEPGGASAGEGVGVAQAARASSIKPIRHVKLRIPR